MVPVDPYRTGRQHDLKNFACMHQNVCTVNYISRSCGARVHLGHGNVRMEVLLPEFSNGSHRFLPTVSKFIQCTDSPTNQASKQLTRQPNKQTNQPTESAKDHIIQRIGRPTKEPTKPINETTYKSANKPKDHFSNSSLQILS